MKWIGKCSSVCLLSVSTERSRVWSCGSWACVIYVCFEAPYIYAADKCPYKIESHILQLTSIGVALSCWTNESGIVAGGMIDGKEAYGMGVVAFPETRGYNVSIAALCTVVSTSTTRFALNWRGRHWLRLVFKCAKSYASFSSEGTTKHLNRVLCQLAGLQLCKACMQEYKPMNHVHGCAFITCNFCAISIATTSCRRCSVWRCLQSRKSQRIQRSRAGGSVVVADV